MAKLYLKFEQNGQVLKEVFLSQAATTIGRLPDNSLQIDNLAVSGHHAKIAWETDHYVVEDLGSLNGTYVNNERVGKATLKHGDLVKIGKHIVEFKNESAVPNFAVAAKTGPSAPKLEATMVLDTRQAREKLADKNGPSAGSGPLGISRPAWMSEPFAAAKDRVGLLDILQGKTDQQKYVLTGKMTMIGKSSMASIKLKGFFAPTTAALISKRDNKYFISPSESKARLKINGEDVASQRELNAGDVIEVGKVKAAFSFQD
ncbi:MAG TPA: FHA domain-containing protein [Candidatus Polarisedimenticolia bacterium]|nr:FHA domain-containing protein [Candidatus Polarisedimenticolia bacterium]